MITRKTTKVVVMQGIALVNGRRVHAPPPLDDDPHTQALYAIAAQAQAAGASVLVAAHEEAGVTRFTVHPDGSITPGRGRRQGVVIGGVVTGAVLLVAALFGAVVSTGSSDSPRATREIPVTPAAASTSAPPASPTPMPAAPRVGVFAHATAAGPTLVLGARTSAGRVPVTVRVVHRGQVVELRRVVLGPRDTSARFRVGPGRFRWTIRGERAVPVAGRITIHPAPTAPSSAPAVVPPAPSRSSAPAPRPTTNPGRPPKGSVGGGAKGKPKNKGPVKPPPPLTTGAPAPVPVPGR